VRARAPVVRARARARARARSVAVVRARVRARVCLNLCVAAIDNVIDRRMRGLPIIATASQLCLTAHDSFAAFFFIALL
jgi:hypothetical protein